MFGWFECIIQPMNNTILEISSKGLYSSWCYHKPSRTLFDCGEGFATFEGNYIYGVERVMLSHGHGDHVLGLPSLIGCRNSARGDRKKTLTIYYPAGDWLIESLKTFIIGRNSNLRYDLKWVPIGPDFNIEIDNNHYIQSFPMDHQKKGMTLGYRILEKRKKLRPEFEGKNISDLLRSGTVRKDEISLEYEANVFSYCLDAFQLYPHYIQGSELVVMDCTFLKESDREDNTHYTLNESYEECVRTGVKQMIAAHFSPRYLYPQIRDDVEEINNKHGSKFIIPVYHNVVTEI